MTHSMKENAQEASSGSSIAISAQR